VSEAGGGPLAGVRVIDLTSAVLGPVATQILGDMGAEVVKVEPPQGDTMRQVGPTRGSDMAVMFLNINRNKRSVVLDLKREQARRALLRLIDGADVLVHNMRVGAAERLGLSYAALAPRNPRLIHASATGFRKDGRHRDRPAFDDVIQGMSGLAALNAMRDGGEPRYVPSAIADKFCGHVLASAVAMALYRRERTGLGQEVHVPMLETMVSFNLAEHLWGGVLDDPSLGLGYGRMFTPYRRPFRTNDGYLCMMANSDDQWQRLLSALGRPDLAEDPRFARLAQRAVNIGALYAIVEEVMRTRSTDEWQARLDAADVPNGPVHGLADLLEDDYLAETGFFRRVEHPSEGRMLVTAVPVDFSEWSRSAIELARQIAPQASLVLMHAVEVPFEGKMRTAGVAEDTVMRYRDTARREAQQRLRGLATDAELDTERVLLSTPSGADPWMLIVQEEQEQDCDLVVIGRQGRHALDEFLLGSTTRMVVADGAADVLISTRQAR